MNSTKPEKYTTTCKCGNVMRVKKKHFGRMCRCTKCNYPIYVTFDNVYPPVKAFQKDTFRYFGEKEVPMKWEKGDLLMETYEVRELLGEGGMGTVYRVYHRGWGIDLAVKSPKTMRRHDQRWIENFEHECETWVNLSPHPNTVECYYVRRLGGIPRVFIEYVHGPNLARRINDKRLYHGGHREAVDRILDVGIQFARGLHHAHSEGVIHQDVKPANVIVGFDGTVKVTDFGLARVWREGASDSSDSSDLDNLDTPKVEVRGPTGGTPIYRSPDHARGEPVGHKTDIWSWAVSMMEMFAGEIFWSKGAAAREALDSLLIHGSRYEMIPAMPSGLRELLYRCFSIDPDDRPADMMEVETALIDIYEGELREPYERPRAAPGGASSDKLNNRAVSLLDLGKSWEAEVLWRRILDSEPEHLQAFYNYQLHRWRTGRLTDTDLISTLYKLCNTREEEWVPRYLLGRVLMERGDCATATEVLQRACNGTMPRDVSFSLAMAQNKMADDKVLLWECEPEDASVSAVDIAPDASTAFSGYSDGTLRAWDVQNGGPIRSIQAHEGRVHALWYLHNTGTLLSGGADGLLKLWNPETGRLVRTYEGHDDKVRCLTGSRNEKLALTGSRDATMRLWDIESGNCVRVLEGHNDSINAVVLSRCGNYALSGSRDRTVRLWDVKTGECLKTLSGNHRAVTGVCLNADASLAISCSGRKIKTWDLETGHVVRSNRGHNKEVHAIALSDDERVILSATSTGTLKFWVFETGQCLRSLRGHAPLRLTQDGRYLISGSGRGAFKVWQVNCHANPFPAAFLVSHTSEAANPDIS